MGFRKTTIIGAGAVESFPQGTVSVFADLPDYTFHLGEIWFVESPKYFAIHTRGFPGATASIPQRRARAVTSTRWRASSDTDPIMKVSDESP